MVKKSNKLVFTVNSEDSTNSSTDSSWSNKTDTVLSSNSSMSSEK